jgi:short-subunit dehydrogenase
MNSLQDKVIWITGASSGIGEALAYVLAREGARLILSARREEELKRVQLNTGLSEDRCLLLPLDLAQAETLTAKVLKALTHYEHVDILINNGGISQRSLAKDTLLEVDRRIMEINFFGTVALSKALLPYMLKRKKGMFVVVSSAVGKFGTPLRSAYSASKHALHGFFDSLRAEVWQDNIQVLMVCPGYIKTQVSVNALTGRGEKQGTMDEAQANGISAEHCAAKIIEGIKSAKEEIYIGGSKELSGIYLKRFLPGLFSKILRKSKVT